MLFLKSAVQIGHLLELLPMRVFLVEFLPVVRQEEECEHREQHSPERPPQTQRVQQRLESDAVVNDIRRKHEVEGDGVGVVGDAVYLGDLLVDELQLDVLRLFGGEAVEVVREHLGPHDLKLEGDPFIESIDDEEVILEVSVTVIIDFGFGDRTSI